MKQRTIRALYRWLSVIIALLAFILVPFFLFESTTENTAFQYLHANQETGIVATVAAALLALDVFLPIPSSIISTTVGSVLGMAAGTVVSFVGMTTGCVLGWYFGQRVGGPSAGALLGDREYERLRSLFSRYGALAISLCRPVPVAAEASIILAGASGMTFKKSIGVAALSSFGVSLVYASIGAYAFNIQSFLFAFLGAILLPVLFFLLYRLTTKRSVGK